MSKDKKCCGACGSAKITPLGGRVLLKREEEAEEIKGGIIIPDSAKEKPLEAKVVALGTGKIEDGKKVPFCVSVGDRVLIAKYSGIDVKLGNEDFVLAQEDEIMAILG